MVPQFSKSASIAMHGISVWAVLRAEMSALCYTVQAGPRVHRTITPEYTGVPGVMVLVFMVRLVHNGIGWYRALENWGTMIPFTPV